MPSKNPVHKQLIRGALYKGPELEKYADAIWAELPKNCADCPAAFAIRCAITDTTGWLPPRTPEAARLKTMHGESSHTRLSGTAQYALKGLVSDANEGLCEEGPKNDGLTCGLDAEKRTDYTKNPW
jgi:hypothetical protein